MYFSFAILCTSILHYTIGYISQNLYLNSSHLGIATRGVGGFYDDRISRLIPNNTDDVMLVHLFGKEPELFYEQIKLNINEYFQK